MAEVGVVAIGRNEGDRLRGCLQSALRACPAVVYVDSASSDRSVEFAHALGISVVEMAPASRLGPSRARNAGLVRLLELHPNVEFVQFIDADSELSDGWIQMGVGELQRNPNVAAVCGHLRERFPDATIYNKLRQIEWEQPVGECAACAGTFMIRVESFQQVGGFNPEVLAGEEPELCLRLRNRGWKILRLDSPMAVHDAAMTRFAQWWLRAVRCGYAYAQGASLHGDAPARHCVRNTLLVWLWGFFIPGFSVAAAWPSGGLSLLMLLLIYLAQFGRMYWRGRARPLSRRTAAAYALSCMACRFAHIYGFWQFAMDRIHRAPTRLIEYR